MPGDGHPGRSADVGHELETASSSKKHILKLKCPQWFTSGKYLEAPNPDSSNGDFASFAAMGVPKRRGRPPKTGYHQPAKSLIRTKASTLSKPAATRLSRRKLLEVNGDADYQDIEMGDAASDETGQDRALQGRLDDSRGRSGEASIKDEKPDPSMLDHSLDGAIDGARLGALTNGRSTPKKNSEMGFDISTTSPTIIAAARLDSGKLNEQPIASIEAHDHLEDEDDEPVGMVTRAAARSKSAVPNLSTSKAPGTATVLNAEDSFSSMNGTGMEAASVPGTPQAKGRGRWPNGALKAKAAAAGVSTATFKKSLGKKKGAPGKRKTSDNAIVQAAYDRQAHLRSQYKDLRKMLLKSEISYLERTLEQLRDDPESFKETPNYEEVIKFLENRRTAVVANREKEEQLQKQLLQRQFDGEVSNTWNLFSGQVKDLMTKYEMKGKRAYLDLIQSAAPEEDDNLSVYEGGEYELADLNEFNDEREALTEVPTPEDNEPSKKGKAVTKPKRGKKRALEDEPLVQQIAKRHAPAMLSATTHPEEESEADKPAAPTPVVSVGPRGKNKYHFDEHGVYVPTEAKKGPQREEPNNRVVIEPWFEFEKHEIGLRNLYDELNEVKPKPQFPTGYWHLDPHRGIYSISNREEDYDKKLVEIFGVHPTMGLPCKGSRNPEDVFPRTDYEHVLKNLAPPLRYIDDEHPEAVSTSKSWDIIITERDWLKFERRMRFDEGFELKQKYGQEKLATFDAVARDYTDGVNAVDNMLEAAESLERETPKPAARTVSPSPGKRQSARQKARAEAAAAKARPATPVTPPQTAPPITSTAKLSVLADASEYFQVQEMQQMHSPRPPQRHLVAHSYQPSPPAPRTQSQLPHISFINNPMPPSDLRPLAPLPQQTQHHQQSQPFLQPRPQPMEMQRQYQQPGMMAPPPPQSRMPLPYPSMQSHQPHQPSLFYGSHQSPPQQQQPLQRPNLRPGPGLRSLLPRTMPGEPPGPPTQHHHINHQQVTFYNPGPPPPPQHMGPDHQRYFDGPPQHISPYRNEPYQPYTPGPPGPPGPPPGYGPFRHHSPRR